MVAARVLAGRAGLPPLHEQRRWEKERIQKKRDGVPFTALWPDFEEYFESVRCLAGEQGPGRKLPVFDPEWVKTFLEGHEKRKQVWEKRNVEAADREHRMPKKLAKF